MPANAKSGTQADPLQLPHIPLCLQARYLPYDQLESRDRHCYRPPRPRLRPLSRHFPYLPLMDISARHRLCALPVLLDSRSHQCALQPLHTREIITVDPFIRGRSRSLHNLKPHVHYSSSSHLPKDLYCKSEGCDAPIPLRLNGCYDAGIRATAAAVATASAPAGGCEATKSGQRPIDFQNRLAWQRR